MAETNSPAPEPESPEQHLAPGQAYLEDESVDPTSHRAEVLVEQGVTDPATAYVLAGGKVEPAPPVEPQAPKPQRKPRRRRENKFTDVGDPGTEERAESDKRVYDAAHPDESTSTATPEDAAKARADLSRLRAAREVVLALDDSGNDSKIQLALLRSRRSKREAS